MNRIKKDIIIAFCLIVYVFILALANPRMSMDRLSNDIEVFAGTFLVLGLLYLEKAYKFDDGKIAITSIELLIMSFYSLSITHIIALIKIEFINYMFFSAGAIGVYYLIKEIIIYTKQKKKDLKDLSDISEIVKKDEPIKKEAKKRNIEEKGNKNSSQENNNQKDKNIKEKYSNPKAITEKSKDKVSTTKKKTNKKNIAKKKK